MRKNKLTAVACQIMVPFADMHENLKVVLNTPIRNRYVVGFKTKEEIGEIPAFLSLILLSNNFHILQTSPTNQMKMKMQYKI